LKIKWQDVVSIQVGHLSTFFILFPSFYGHSFDYLQKLAMIFGPGVKTHYILARECQRLLRTVHESSISQCSKRPEVETYKKHGPGLLQRTECLLAVNATKMELKISKQKFAESNQTRGMGQSLFFVIFCMVLQTVFYVFRPLTLKGQMFQAEHATR